MKKVPILCLVMILVHLYTFAQISFRVFPTILHGDLYEDTLLNTSAILKKAGITQVNISNILPEIKSTFTKKTININMNGCIDKATICFTINQSNTSILCISDKIVYDSSGKITDIETTDNKSNNYPQRHREYIRGYEAN